MVERTGNPFADITDEDTEDFKRFRDVDTQPLCDNCNGKIEGVRVLKMRGYNYMGAFCSYKCSRDWDDKELQIDSDNKLQDGQRKSPEEDKIKDKKSMGDLHKS